MKLSAPVYRLKRQARLLSRTAVIPYHQALKRVARKEGFDSWSLLLHKLNASNPAKLIEKQLRPGELLLLGARPGQGKTLLGLEISIAAMERGKMAAFFSLEYSEQEIIERFRHLGVTPADYQNCFMLECSDDICADFVMNRLEPKIVS